MDNQITTLHDSIRAAQRSVAAPTVEMQMRDAVLVEVVRGWIPKIGLTHAELGWKPEVVAKQVHEIVDEIMRERRKRVRRCLKEIEAWGLKRLQSEGVALLTNVDVILTAMIHRFGGSVEIPVQELKDTDEGVAYLDIIEDKDRGVLTVRPVKPPQDPMQTPVS